MTLSTQSDVRVTIISRIWAYAAAMLFISLLLQGQDRKVFLPVAIVFGAATSTIVVLRKFRDYRHETLLRAETLEALKQRVENLEAIASSDDRYWDHQKNGLETPC